MKENVPLASLTTFHIGGPARYFTEAQSVEEVKETLAFARANSLSVFVLGGGSNLLVPDGGVDGVVLKMAMRDMNFESDGADTLLITGAGASWDGVVDAAGEKGIFGVENLAGIPGTVGGAVVQNIGAYGA
ncbi:MAG: FAD-binding protein, partial [Patescibacteria group bacterium]